MEIERTTAAKCRNADELACRAEVVARYVAIGVPTREDDESFAAELGLKPDSLIRLARAWRLHGETRALHGAYTQITDQDRLNALDATVDPDLTGVTPSRREQTLRRIEALRRYLSIPEPTHEDMLQIASSIGLREQGFRQMLRNWLLHRSPMALPAAQRPLSVTKRKKPKMDKRVEKLIAEALAEVPVNAPARRVHLRVAALCRAESLKPPGSSTIYYRVMQARAAADQTASPLICVDHSAVLLAVEGPYGPQVPVLSLVFARPSGRILAHSLSLEAPSPSSTASLLAQVADQQRRRNFTESKLDIGFEGESWAGLACALAHAGVGIADPDRSFKPGKGIGQTMGNIIGNVRTCPRFTRRPTALPGKAVGADHPFTFAQAVAAVDDAIKLHNEGRPISSLTFVPSGNAAALADRLQAISVAAESKLGQAVPPIAKASHPGNEAPQTIA